MAKSEDTFIPLPVNERELAIEDLAFSSNPKNDKAIKYAIECINKLAKIEEIINETNRRESVLVNPEPKITVRSMGFDKIREVLENE